MITYDEFKKVELKVAQIKEVSAHPNADRLYIVKVDVGGAERQLVAGIRLHYKPEELVGKYIVVVNNLEPSEIRGIKSEGMLLAAQDESVLTILTVDRPVKSGSVVK